MYTMLRIGTAQGDLTFLYTKKSSDFFDKIKKAKENIKYIDCIKYIEETKRDLNLNCNYDMCIDKLLFKIFS